MTLEEAAASSLLPASCALAVGAIVMMLLHVARRYPASPKHVPIGLRFDGRPRRLGPKVTLWAAPVALTAAAAVVGSILLGSPAREDHRTLTMLIFVVLAEVAAVVAWCTDRQIELARKQTFRIAPSRTLLVVLPLLATVAALVVVVLRDGA